MKITMLVGVPGVGKSWVTKQLQDKYHLIHHDLFIGMAGKAYVEAILREAPKATKPVLIEAPFSISTIKEPLELQGFEVTPVFIIEEPHILSHRYVNDRNRDGKPLPSGHLTRQRTYLERAKKWGSFVGNSSEVLKHLQTV